MPTVEELAARLAALERQIGENVAHHAGEHRATGRDPLNIRAAGGVGIDYAALQNIPVAAAHDAVSLSGGAAELMFGLVAQALSLDSQNANAVLAGPASGGGSPPTFRNLVAADIPLPYDIYIPFGFSMDGISVTP